MAAGLVGGRLGEGGGQKTTFHGGSWHGISQPGAYVSIYIHTYIHTYMHTYVCTFIYVHIYIRGYIDR